MLFPVIYEELVAVWVGHLDARYVSRPGAEKARSQQEEWLDSGSVSLAGGRPWES